MSITIHTAVIEGLSCGNCGIVFGLEQSMHQKRLKDGEKFYCPSGCHIAYGNCENTRLKEQIKEEQKRTARERELAELARKRRDEALAEAEHFRKSRDGMKGAYRKVAVRVKNGVCPCCQRTFACLADHMKQKHPEFAVEPKL